MRFADSIPHIIDDFGLSPEGYPLEIKWLK